MSSTSAAQIFIASSEGHAGKSMIALALVDELARRAGRVGVFRPVLHSRDKADSVVDLLVGHEGVVTDAHQAAGVTYEEVHADPEQALSTIVARHRELAAQCDALVIVGSDFTDVASPTEFSYNARVAANLGAPILLVIPDLERDPAAVLQVAEAAVTEAGHAHATVAGILVNRVTDESTTAIVDALAGLDVPTWAVPEIPVLAAPTVNQIAEALDAELIMGESELMGREAEHLLVAGMNPEHVLERLVEGQLVVAAGDRPELLITLLAAHASASCPSLAGIVLNGGFRPSAVVRDLVGGLEQRLPVLATDHGTYETASIIAGTRGVISHGTQRKRDLTLSTISANVDLEQVMSIMELPRPQVVTPLMFEATLLDRARGDQQHIVLPEGNDDRVLRAASTLLARGAAQLTLLGKDRDVRARAAELGLELADAAVVDPSESDWREEFAETYAELRAHKQMTVEQAYDIVTDVSYFGTMMVHTGRADGMVSGAAHTTAHTIKPSFEIIKTVPGTSIVSSVFLMCLADRVLVYGDCAVNPDPTSEQLADIAISSAATSAQFGVEPRIAMLSYSTGDSGSGAEVEKVRTATELVRERRPDLSVEGPIQYDAAVDASVATAKMPGSSVAGRATVFIFPDLNTGNNTYKAVQRSAGAVAIGPVLQGLNKPVNDLSRGALVNDIVNTVAITAIQAQATKAQAIRAQETKES